MTTLTPPGETQPASQGSVRAMAVRARQAGRQLAVLDTSAKNAALLEVASELEARRAEILAANGLDVETARASGLSDALVDRLTLTPARFSALLADVRQVATLPDPVGQLLGERELPSGVTVLRRRVPLGVLGVIYESRPNVTVDVATLALKSGNAVILRGGRETARSNAALVEAVSAALTHCGLPGSAVQVITDPDRALLLELLRQDELIDAIIPRGGAGLHRFCVENATVPVIVGGVGVVHLYLDPSYADEGGAVRVIHNSKVQRPSACNALDTLLIHRAALPMLPAAGRDLVAAGVQLRADPEALATLTAAGVAATAAEDSDFGQEFLSLVLSVKTVDGLDPALEHIARHGGHTEAILSADAAQLTRFEREVDSAAVMINASTRFNDGGQLGLGAEVAVSTQKLHARGPMGLEELTTTKWVVRGHGEVRQ